MIHKLCVKYGTFIDKLEGEDYYCFPKLHQLKSATENELIELGFGYRSKYLVNVVKEIELKGGSPWLESLRQEDTDMVLTELTKLSGIGPKVAHCISLFSLSKFNLVPVDTHVFQIAQRYLEHLKTKDPHNKYHGDISRLFIDTFGDYAGWAHTILFAAELPLFKSLIESYGIHLPTKTIKKKKPNPNKNMKTKPKKPSRSKSTTSQIQPSSKKTKVIVDDEITISIAERVKRRRNTKTNNYS